MQTNDRLQLADLARKLDALGFGERGKAVDELARLWGCSRQKIYNGLKSHVGWSPQRKARSDKGKTKVPEAHLLIASAMVREGHRKNGKSTMPMTEAFSIMAGNALHPGVTVDRLQRVAVSRKLDAKSQTQARPHTPMRVPHVNYMHEVDASVCVIFYLRGKLHFMREQEFNKNKEKNAAKIKLRVWRYALWEAASGSIKVRYYEAAGETSRNLAEFILWAWSTGPRHAPYGVPKYLYMDAGSANTAHAIMNLFHALDVVVENHLPEAARATGGVENSHNIIERSLESRLRISPVESVEQLNEFAESWAYAFNENLIPGKKSLLHRNSNVVGVRADLFRLLQAEHTRLLPDLAICRALMEGKLIERKVSGGLVITFKHPAAKTVRTYSVSGLDGVSVGDKVRVSPLVYGDCAIRIRVEIYNGGDKVYHLEPKVELDQFGNFADAPVWFEDYHSHKHTVVDGQSKRLDELAFPHAKTDEDLRKARAKNSTPLVGVLEGKSLNALQHLQNIVGPTSLPKRGETINVPDHVSVAPPIPLTHFAACKAIVGLLQRPLTTDENAQVRAWYPDGVLEDSVPMVAACVANGTTPFNVGRVLRVAS
jgi:hypothetical protein